MLSAIWIAGLALAFAVLFIVLITRKRTTSEEEEKLKRFSSALSWLRDEGHKILVRPSGDVSGVIYDEERYHDEAHDGKKRRRFRYYDLDGEDRTDPADAYNSETGKVEDIVSIEKDGGAAVTWLANPEGELEPIMTGSMAEKLKVDRDDYQALAAEFENMKEDYRSKDRAYRKLQNKVSRLEREKSEMEDEVEDYSQNFERMMGLVRKLRARLRGTEARATMLEEELESLGARHEDLTEETQEAIEKARERMTERMKSAPEVTGEEEWATREEVEKIKEMLPEGETEAG